MATGDPHLYYQVSGTSAYVHSSNIANTEYPGGSDYYQPQGWWMVPDFQVDIKPILPNSKFLVMCDLIAGSAYWELQAKILRNGNEIMAGIPEDSRAACSMSDNNYEWASTANYSQYSTYIMNLNLIDNPMSTTYGGTSPTANNTQAVSAVTGLAAEPSAGPIGTSDVLSYNVILNSYNSNSISANNTWHESNTSDYWGSPVSTLTVMEIAQ